MARWSDRRRITPEGTKPPDEFPSLRKRSPVTYWVLMFLVASLVIGPVILVIQFLI